MNLINNIDSSTANKNLDDSMIPAINIVFLLLIFFMIAGQIESTNDQLQIPESVSETELSEQDLTIQIMANGDHYLNGDMITTTLNQQFKSLAVSPLTSVTFHIHKDLPASSLDPVLEAVRLSGIKRLSIATDFH